MNKAPYTNGPATRFGETGIPIALQEARKQPPGIVSAWYRGIIQGRLIEVEVRDMDFTRELDHMPLLLSEMWVDAAVAKSAVLPYAGSQVERGMGTIWFMATINDRPYTVTLKGLPKLTERQLEDIFNGATAKVSWKEMVSSRAPAVERPHFRELPKFKGYTVDQRLREFRKTTPDKVFEIVPFDGERGQQLLRELRAHIEGKADWGGGRVPQTEGKTYDTFKCPLCGMESRVNKFGDILDTKVRQWHPYIAKVDSMVCAKSNPTPMRVDLLRKETLEKIKVRGKETGTGRVPQTEPTCPICGGPGASMGVLGRKHWFRCRHCGMEWSIDAKRSSRLPSMTAGTEETHSLKQLQDMARARGVSTSGTKRTLIRRLGV